MQDEMNRKRGVKRKLASNLQKLRINTSTPHVYPLRIQYAIEIETVTTFTHKFIRYKKFEEDGRHI